MKPFFSVVVTVYNKQEFISDTLKSVFDQSFDKLEIIVVNDGSTDNSLSIINSYRNENLKLIDQRNGGASKARNVGIAASSADYIALLDGDDLWHEDYLQNIYNAIQEHPEESVFATAIALKYGDVLKPVDYGLKNPNTVNSINFFENSLRHQLLSSSSLVFKSSILKLTGNFDENIHSGQDIDMWIRIGLDFNIVFVNKVLAYYTYAINSLSNTTFDLEKKPKFDKYLEQEKQDKNLKQYLDKNRYAMALMSKLYDNKKAYIFYRNHLNLENLSQRQRFLINCPKWLLNTFLKIKEVKGEKLYYKPLKARKSL